MNLEDIISVVCKHTGVERDDLLTKSRKGKLAITKKFIYYFACHCTYDTLADIGNITANEPHDLVLFGKKRIEEWLMYDDIYAMVEIIKLDLSKIEPLPDFSYQNYRDRRMKNMSRQFFTSKQEAIKQNMKYDIHTRQYAKL